MHKACVSLLEFGLDQTQDLWFSPVFVVCRRFIFLLLPLPLSQGHHLLEVTGSSLLFLTFNLLFPLSAKPILPLTPSFLLSLLTHMHPPPDPVSSNLYIKPEDLHAAGKKKRYSASFPPENTKYLRCCCGPTPLTPDELAPTCISVLWHLCGPSAFFSFPSRCIFVCGVFVRHRTVVNAILFCVAPCKLGFVTQSPKVRHKT